MEFHNDFVQFGELAEKPLFLDLLWSLHDIFTMFLQGRYDAPANVFSLLVDHF